MTQVLADYDNKTLTLPHLGITLRVMMAAAANANEGREFKNRWNLVYKDQDVGMVRLKRFKD